MDQTQKVRGLDAPLVNVARPRLRACEVQRRAQSVRCGERDTSSGAVLR